MRTFHVHNFGCRASQADGAAIESQLAGVGLAEAAQRPAADLVVINTCTVTSTADDEVRQMVRRVHRENPSARILVTGCMAQREPDTLAALDGVEWVVGNSHKTAIASIVTAADYHGQVHVSDIFAQQEFLSAPVEDAPGDRSRPNLKIQDGCNNRCSFCIIPSVRGRSRSMNADDVVSQVAKLSRHAAEVVLTGINLGRWGREPFSTMRLADLVRRLLDETDVQRLRLSSVEPMDFSGDLLRLMASTDRIARHVHAPLQSGSDTVLKRMHRKYRTRHYRERMETARSLMPDAAIGADVMTGFPGETDAEFEETVRFIESLPFSYLHVFTYSERPGTPAASFDQVPVRVRRDRTRALRDLSDRKALEFRRGLIGRTLSVATLGGTRSLSSNYVQVELASPAPERQLRDAVAGAVTGTGVREAAALRVL